MSVQLLDLRAQYAQIRDEIDAVVADVFSSQRFIGGPHVESLENEVAAYAGVRYAVALASGTDALLLALKAAGIGPGDEVITTPFTFFATAGAIHNAGARPVFVDIERDTFNIDPHRVADAVTEHTKAIVPVHLFGQSADMDPILEVAHQHGLVVLEDAAQALGARYRDRPAGTMGAMGALSFFPSKNLGGAGEGGMVLTSDDSLAKTLQLLRNHGQGSQYVHALVGTNSRLDALQAAVLRVKLKHLDAWAEGRRENAARYTEQFGALEGVTPPPIREDRYHVFNQYTIRIPKRDDCLALFRERDIGAAVYYPLPLHMQECFSYLGYEPGDMPEAERASREALSLPVYPELPRDHQETVIAAIRDHLARL